VGVFARKVAAVEAQRCCRHQRGRGVSNLERDGVVGQNLADDLLERWGGRVGRGAQHTTAALGVEHECTGMLRPAVVERTATARQAWRTPTSSLPDAKQVLPLGSTKRKPLVAAHEDSWKAEAELSRRRPSAWCSKGARNVVLVPLAAQAETGLEAATGLRMGARRGQGTTRSEEQRM
jgi:hypothetical protein